MTQRHLLQAAIVGAVLTTLGCGLQVTGPDLIGQWGGEHVSLQITPTGAQAEYDCANGVMEDPIQPTNGKFEASGTHVFEHGGPIREGEQPDAHPALYSGTTNGRTMTYTVKIVDTGLELGPFTLRAGEQGRLFKCL